MRTPSAEAKEQDEFAFDSFRPNLRMREKATVHEGAHSVANSQKAESRNADAQGHPLLAECDWDCGFVGSAVEVEEHEKNCASMLAATAWKEETVNSFHFHPMHKSFR